jgi:hypothetical protein
MNYAQLVQAVQDYCENSEATFVANIPTFVRQAERRIYRSVMIPELRANATTTVNPGSRYIVRPINFLSVFSFAVIADDGSYTYMVGKDVSFIREAFPFPATSGTPKYYAIFDGDAPGGEGNFIIGPSTDAAYTVELHYYYDPESIVTAGTTWLGDNAEPALLYGALIEAYTYMKGDADLMTTYDARYQEAMSQLAGIDLRSKRDDYRDGQLR